MSEGEVGRLTLRKWYLLLAEWYTQQRLIDSRWYKLICCHCAKAPEAGAVFPLLAGLTAAPDEPDYEDDVMSFQQTTAVLSTAGR